MIFEVMVGEDDKQGDTNPQYGNGMNVKTYPSIDEPVVLGADRIRCCSLEVAEHCRKGCDESRDYKNVTEITDEIVHHDGK